MIARLVRPALTCGFCSAVSVQVTLWFLDRLIEGQPVWVVLAALLMTAANFFAYLMAELIGAWLVGSLRLVRRVEGRGRAASAEERLEIIAGGDAIENA